MIKTLPLESGLSLNGPWSKQNIIVETTDDYPKKVCISVWNGRVDISELEIGKEYLFHCNVESNEYKGKWYTILTLWSVDSANKEPTGRPLLSFFSPILKGNESNLEILQKFQSEIRPRFTYTKGIRVGDKISNEDLAVNQKALEYFEFFKNWMNEVAYISIRETMNEFLVIKRAFLSFM
ncbi:MAG: DUF3127 domain-containing protein [Bacteroidales bacterium]|nr:DUF3127 domain-containing protein [Bacteroidales bacterium]